MFIGRYFFADLVVGHLCHSACNRTREARNRRSTWSNTPPNWWHPCRRIDHLLRKRCRRRSTSFSMAGNATAALSRGSAFDIVQRILRRRQCLAGAASEGLRPWRQRRSSLARADRRSRRVDAGRRIERRRFDLTAAKRHVAVWFMNGTIMRWSAAIRSIVPDWRLIGAADFHHVGSIELLWQAPAESFALWTLRAATVTATQFALTGQSAWKVLGVRD